MQAPNSQKLKIYTLLSSLMILIGVLLMTYMITVESEPGALPLFLVLLGTGWLIITRIRSRKQSQ